MDGTIYRKYALYLDQRLAGLFQTRGKAIKRANELFPGRLCRILDVESMKVVWGA